MLGWVQPLGQEWLVKAARCQCGILRCYKMARGVLVVVLLVQV